MGKVLLFSIPILVIGCGEPATYHDGVQLRIDRFNAKEVAAKVLEAKSTINDSGIITSEGFTNIQKSRKGRTTYYDDYQCYYGGSASVVFGDHDEDLYLSSGDDFSIDYAECGINADDFQGAINGAISLKLYEVYEDTYSDVMDYDVTYKNTDLTSQTSSIRLNGAMQVYYYDDKTENDLYLKFYASELRVDNQYESTILEETALDFFSDLSTAYYEYTFDGTLFSDGLNGTLYFTTTALFQGYGDAYPQEGELIINAYDNSSLTLKVIDESSVDLLIDSNGDGYHEEVIHTTWYALL